MNDRHVPDIGLGEMARRALREHLEPGGGPAYWESLHARILARIAAAGAEPEWWMVLGGWARVGIAAAVIAMFLAGAALATVIAPDATAAYQEVVVNPPVPVPPPVVAGAPADAAREETFRLIISY